MRILILAPQPFYQERGTPIAVRLLAQALTEQGHTVELLTFAEGTDVAMNGLCIHRLKTPACLNGIQPGFSPKKLVCDAYMLAHAWRLVRDVKPNVIHAVEESLFIAHLLSIRFRIPYIYDMDSSIPDQIVEKYGFMKPLRRLMHAVFGHAASRALAVVPVNDALKETAAKYYVPKRIVVLHDISLLTPDAARTELTLRRDLSIKGICFMYIGNLESYQGIDLLLESFARLHQRQPDSGLIVVGGIPTLIKHYRARAAALGIASSAHFIGPRPTSLMAALFHECDVLVSPRIKGVNTPMKIYSYLDSGKAVLATRLLTHTQVMNDSVALLAEPNPTAFATAMETLGSDSALRERLAANAKRMIGERHSYAAFKNKIADLYALVNQEVARP